MLLAAQTWLRRNLKQPAAISRTAVGPFRSARHGGCIGVADLLAVPYYNSELRKDCEPLSWRQASGLLAGRAADAGQPPCVQVRRAYSQGWTAECEAEFERFRGISIESILSGGGDWNPNVKPIGPHKIQKPSDI